MPTTAIVKNAVPILELEECVIGSQLKIAVQFEELVSEDPDVFELMDFDNIEIKADIKDSVRKDIEPDATFECSARVGDPGWIDLYLGGDVTGTLLAKVYRSSIKIWPTAHEEQGDTLLELVIPMVFKATR